MSVIDYHSVFKGFAAALPYISFVFYLTLSIMVSLHILLKKQENKTALAWVALVWFSPFFGSLLYMAFGINRIWRKTKLLKSPQIKKTIAQLNKVKRNNESYAVSEQINKLSHINSNLIDFPLCEGNDIKPLINGEQAYKKMLSAIDKAEKSISLCSYIFDDDRIGKQFADALIKASKRGVEVCVLIDAVGLRYSFPSIVYRFKNSAVKIKRFLPTVLPWKLTYINLRNHRKILIVDGHEGFTGGMNIREGHCISGGSQHKIQDVHFYVKGPVVKQMQITFVMDWLYATGHTLEGKAWFPALKSEGESIIRGIADGPDEDINTIQLVLCSVITQAKKNIDIMTPYFLPNETLITLLKVAYKRGVRINILVPKNNNLKMVHWASQKTLRELQAWGCKVYFSQDPFEHTKLMLVDDEWACVGSSNWDERSLRLNFEFNLEVYDQSFVKKLNMIFTEKMQQAEKMKQDDQVKSSLLEELKEGFARLFIQYL